MNLGNGRLVVKNHHRLGWRWPRYYHPTGDLHGHGFFLGPLTFWWGRRLSDRTL